MSFEVLYYHQANQTWQRAKIPQDIKISQLEIKKTIQINSIYNATLITLESHQKSRIYSEQTMQYRESSYAVGGVQHLEILHHAGLMELSSHRQENAQSTPQRSLITTYLDLHDGRVMPPQQAAIITYSNRAIATVNTALQCHQRTNSWYH